MKVRRQPSGQVDVTNKLKGAVDPLVEVRLLFAGGPDGHDLLTHLRDYTAALGTPMSDEEMDRRTEGALAPRIGFEWEASLANGQLTTELVIEADQELSVGVRVRPPTQGRLAYALQVIDVETGQYSVGNIVVLEAAQDEVTALL